MMNLSCQSIATAAVLLLSPPPGAFWPNFAGGVILVVGLFTLTRQLSGRAASGPDNLISFAPLFFAMAMAIFGADHFIAAKFVAQIVPSWIPGHLFWTYFVGAALIASALSLATNIQSRLAAMLLGGMILIFVFTIHLPGCFATPFDKTRFTILLRDSTLSLSALAFAASSSCFHRIAHIDREPDSESQTWQSRAATLIISIARFVIAITIAVFGIDHFLYPAAAPGIPQENSNFVFTMPHWIPAHAFWAYATGAVFVICAVAIATGKRARTAATVLGATVLALVLFVYAPIALAHPSDISNGLNYLAIHFALAGAALFLASALPKSARDEVTVPSLHRVPDS